MGKIQIIYRSKKSSSLSDDSIQDILLSALSHNKIYHISGLLLYDETSFVQVIEGEQSTIYQLMNRILLDRRHSNISVLQRKAIVTRQFLNWTMQGISLPRFYKQYYGKIYEKESLFFYRPSDSSTLAHLTLSEIEDVFIFVSDVLNLFPDFGEIPHSEVEKSMFISRAIPVRSKAVLYGK